MATKRGTKPVARAGRVHARSGRASPVHTPQANSLCFAPDGRLVSGGVDGVVRTYDKQLAQLAEHDLAPGRVRKPMKTLSHSTPRTICAIAAGARFVDGVVFLLDAKSLDVVARVAGHDTTQPDTGAKSLGQVAVDTLWVSAGAKGKPIGLTAYAL